MLEGVPLALGGVAAADVLSDDHEAVLDGFGAEGGETVFVVGGADEEDVEGTITGGAVDVGEEGDAVAGFHGDVFFDDDGGRDDVGCGLGGGDERSSGKGSEAEELFEHGNSDGLRREQCIGAGVWGGVSGPESDDRIRTTTNNRRSFDFVWLKKRAKLRS